jgi:hypothetical protein
VRDLVIVSAVPDEPFVNGLTCTLSLHGLKLGAPVSLHAPMRLLPCVDSELAECRFALVVISFDFLALKYERKELDGLASRSRVVSLLRDASEREVALHSPKLAVSAIPGSMVAHLVRRLRALGPIDPFGGTNGPPGRR